MFKMLELRDLRLNLDGETGSFIGCDMAGTSVACKERRPMGPNEVPRLFTGERER